MPAQSLQDAREIVLMHDQGEVADTMEMASMAALITLVSSARSTMHLTDDNQYLTSHGFVFLDRPPRRDAGPG